MNLSKELKKRRDAEERLRNNSPQAIFIGGNGESGDTYITNQQIINNFNDINNTINNITAKALEPLTTGDVDNPELLFVDGDVLMVEV